MEHPEASENLALAVANLTFTKLLIDNELRRISAETGDQRTATTGSVGSND
jgi:hypothetical protein